MLKFNPITGNLDLVGTSGAAPSPNFQATFNDTTDWGSASGGYYSINIGQATHNKGLNPVIQVYELSGSEYELVTVSTSINSSSGDVIIGVVDSPDARFEGKIIISENN